VRVLFGGIRLNDAEEVIVSGDGITAKIIEYIRPLRQGEVARTRLNLEKKFAEDNPEVKEKILKELAIKMREVRKSYSKVIEEKVNSELQDLEMKKAYIEFAFDESQDFLENGMDRVQILICTNVGEGLKSLSKIASGGEISRVMLALKTVLSAYDEIPTMIFDEIDTGISGQAGKAVAEKMKLIRRFII
jgi:DNA repair protein RecN (Recombination protein N)